MVNVRLDQDWTDGHNVHHAAGETVDVDPGTLARLEASGIVASGDGLDDVEIEPLTIGPGRDSQATIGPGSLVRATIGPGSAERGPSGSDDGTIGPGGPGEGDDGTIGPGGPGEGDGDGGSGGLGAGVVIEPLRTIGPGRVERA